MAPWFSASAVASVLKVEWGLDPLGVPLLTVAVQLGFAFGAIVLAASGAPDVLSARRLFFAGAVLAALANLGFAYLADGLATALPLRFVTGVAIAAVYPLGLRLVVGWFRAERGLAIGTLIGALTVGSALPHLFNALGAMGSVDWRFPVVLCSIAALAGGVLVLLTVRDGPLDIPAARFSASVALRAFREPAVRLANLGYLGHMWELYAMWTWVPLFLAGSFAASGTSDPATASLAAFAVVAAGGIGCIVSGLIADRLGRTTVTIAAMTASGTSAVLVGLSFGSAPILVFGLALVWGITVVADSAQFSAAVSELAPPGTAGSALSLQLATGFVLTAVTILGVGALDPGDGSTWRLAFAALAIGPIVGVIAMARLRRRPEALKLAGGHR